MYLSHFILERVDVSVVWERDGWRQGQTAILTQLLLLTIARCVIFKNPLSTYSASWLGLLNRGSLRATALSLQPGPHSGFPISNTSTAAGTCLYSFITSTCFRFFFCLFTQVNFWLTARSRVNIQQHKAIWMGYPIRLELTRVSLLV